MSEIVETKEVNVQEKRGNAFLVVTGILMIIGGAISMLLSILALIAALSNAPGISITGSDKVITIVAVAIALICGILELSAGIVGCKNHKCPEKAGKCLGLGITVLVIAVIGLVLRGVNGDFATIGIGSIVVSILAGIAVPVLYVIGAGINKKRA